MNNCRIDNFIEVRRIQTLLKKSISHQHKNVVLITKMDRRVRFVSVVGGFS
jgi:hypothetical protein